MSAGIESTLDHPLFGPGDADNRACAFVGDGICELGICQCLFFGLPVYGLTVSCEQDTHLVVVAIINQSMFGVDEDPAESTLGEIGAATEDGLCDGGAGEAVGVIMELVLYSW
jgi:hypothetical protein